MEREDEMVKTSAVATDSKHIDCGDASVATTGEREQYRLTVQPPTDPPAPPESDQEVWPRAHPSNYPTSVDVRPRSSTNDSDRQ